MVFWGPGVPALRASSRIEKLGPPMGFRPWLLTDAASRLREGVGHQEKGSVGRTVVIE
jgi:hypothetical protein